MKRQRVCLYGLLTVVAAAAAVLSFAALRDLALVCGFAPSLAWLLPVVVDAGAAAGSLVWLTGAASREAARFARVLALTLLALSVAANALGHGLAAFSLDPAWWVVVIVSAVAPAVLGACVHLAVLVGRADPIPATTEDTTETPKPAEVDKRVEPPAPPRTVAEEAVARRLHLAPPPATSDLTPSTDTDDETGEDEVAKARRLLAEGVGRPTLARELDLEPHQARALIDNPHRVAELLPRYRARREAAQA